MPAAGSGAAGPRDAGGALRLDANLLAPRRARQFLRRRLDGVLRGSRLDTALLLANEVVTNAVRHARPPIQLTVRVVGNMVRVEVTDGSPDLPSVRPAGPAAPFGRGLPLLDALAEAWGADPCGPGKVVWFTLGVPEAGRCADRTALQDLRRDVADLAPAVPRGLPQPAERG